MRGEITKGLTKAAVGHFVKLRYGVYTELGLARGGSFRADVLALNYRKHIVICEVKSSYADFQADNKFLTYLDFCDKLFFIFAQPTWEKYGAKMLPSLKPRGIGVMVLDTNTGWLRSVSPAKTQEIEEETREALILRMAYRGDFTKRNTIRRKVFL